MENADANSTRTMNANGIIIVVEAEVELYCYCNERVCRSAQNKDLLNQVSCCCVDEGTRKIFCETRREKDFSRLNS